MSQLQFEIKQTKAFSSAAEEALLNLQRTADHIQIAFTRLFREHGITSQQYNVLRILRGAGEPLPILEIGDRMVTVVPAITGLIDRLEKQGLVRRTRSEEDRRVVSVTILGQGLKLLGDLDKPLSKLNKQLLDHMEEAELKNLIVLLEKMRSHCPSCQEKG
jgi:DNA-binding MarR family transcriptional regulator